MVIKSQEYVVKPDTPIHLSVRIGDQQAGGTVATLDGNPVPLDATGAGAVGRLGQNLRGSVLVCLTTVKDVNPNTNNTSVTHELRDGEADKAFAYSTSVPADGAIEIYLITYFLK